MSNAAIAAGAGAPTSVTTLAFHSNIGSRHVPYGPLPRQQLDIYVPKNGGVKATILYLYGGGWVSGVSDGGRTGWRTASPPCGPLWPPGQPDGCAPGW